MSGKVTEAPSKKPAESDTASSKTSVTPKKSRARKRPDAAPKEKPEEKPAPEKEKTKAPRVLKRPKLEPELLRLLAVRKTLTDARPLFVRQAAHRYFRIGRWNSWRRPRGLQSKQRRHYGYRSKVVRIGYRSPASVRGLTPTGFRPVLVRTPTDVERIDVRLEAAVIAGSVGTRRRLVLEEVARKLGIRVLNPLVRGEGET